MKSSSGNLFWLHPMDGSRLVCSSLSERDKSYPYARPENSNQKWRGDQKTQPIPCPLSVFSVAAAAPVLPTDMVQNVIADRKKADHDHDHKANRNVGYFITTPGVPVMRPMTDAFSPCDSRIEIALAASDSSRASTMPIPILNMLNISR